MSGAVRIKKENCYAQSDRSCSTSRPGSSNSSSVSPINVKSECGSDNDAADSKSAREQVEQQKLIDDVKQLQDIVAKFRQSQVDFTEYACLRALTLFKAGG